MMLPRCCICRILLRYCQSKVVMNRISSLVSREPHHKHEHNNASSKRAETRKLGNLATTTRYQKIKSLVTSAIVAVVCIFCLLKFGKLLGSAPVSSLSNSASSIRVKPSHHNHNITGFKNKKHPSSPIVQVERADYIYRKTWGAAPIVVESHKLIFFWIPKAGCTTFKHLFRRIMGYSDWKTNGNVHYPKTNGLKYLNQYSIQQATEMMNSNEYTRAIVVRDPKERFLSAYLDKAVPRNGSFVVLACCHKTKTCREQTKTLASFFELTTSCHNPHWRPQGFRMEQKFVPTLDFIGHMGNIQMDVKALLETIGAWDDYGKSGWGPFGNESIFASRSDSSHSTSKSAHDSWTNLLPKYYTAELEAAVEKRFDSDYSIAEFGLPKRKIVFH
jgi:hypothetical protein